MTGDREELINILRHKYYHTLELLRGIEYYKNEYKFTTGRGGYLNYGSPYDDDFPEETIKKVSVFIYKMQSLNKSELLEKSNELEIKNKELAKEWHFWKNKLEQYKEEKIQKNEKYYDNKREYECIMIIIFVVALFLVAYLLDKGVI